MQKLDGWMFKPVSPLRLGVARALFYLWYLVQLIYYRPFAWTAVPQEFWEPSALMSLWMSAPRLSPTTNHLLFGILLVATLLASLGVKTRFSTTVVALVGTWYFGLAACFGQADFHLYPVVLISWILPWSSCGRAFSWDAKSQSRPCPSGSFRWPIRLAHLALLLPMASAGVHKFLGGWLLHPVSTMEYFILYKNTLHARMKHMYPPDFTLSALDYEVVLVLLAYATVTCELGCPLALLDKPKYLKVFLVGGLFLMQLTLARVFFIFPSFPWLAAYLFWVPWEKLWPIEPERSGCDETVASA